MLPQCTRDETAVSSRLPVLLNGRYILDVGLSTLSTSDGHLAATPSVLRARSGNINDTSTQLMINVTERSRAVEDIYRHADQMPSGILDAIRKHQQATKFADIDYYAEAANAVATLQEELLRFDSTYIPNSDVIPALRRLAGLSEYDLGEVLDITKTVEDLEIRIRAEAGIKRALAIRRGGSARRFSKQVLEAYSRTCVFCGFRDSGRMSEANTMFHVNAIAGIQAAHILSWAKYDLDVTQNGVALCPNHHWAFDSHVLTIRYSGNNLVVDRGPTYSIADTDTPENKRQLEDVLGVIPQGRLPHSVDQWVAREFVEQYNDAFSL